MKEIITISILFIAAFCNAQFYSGAGIIHNESSKLIATASISPNIDNYNVLPEIEVDYSASGLRVTPILSYRIPDNSHLWISSGIVLGFKKAIDYRFGISFNNGLFRINPSYELLHKNISITFSISNRLFQ